MKKGDRVLCIKDKWMRQSTGSKPAEHPVSGVVYVISNRMNNYITLEGLPSDEYWNVEAFVLLPIDGIPHEVSGKVVEHAPVK